MIRACRPRQPPLTSRIKLMLVLERSHHQQRLLMPPQLLRDSQVGSPPLGPRAQMLHLWRTWDRSPSKQPKQQPKQPKQQLELQCVRQIDLE